MATVAQIGWGSYDKYEGPLYWGSVKLDKVGPDDSEAAKRLAVIGATEGAAFDAVNMYDRMILSVGIIQFADAGIFLVTDLFGKVYEEVPEAMQPLLDYVKPRGYTFQKTKQGKWRFHLNGVAVETVNAQRELYLLRNSGLKGEWTPAGKMWARGLASAVTSIWTNAQAREVQLREASALLDKMVFVNSKKYLFTDAPDTPIAKAAQAAYLSFAANLPSVADRAIQTFSTTLPKWEEPWLEKLLCHLTFSPGIGIYPDRYNKIRVVLETLWGIDLPDNANLLRQETAGLPPKKVQEILISLGYDLGPSKADGIIGAKTRAALFKYQTDKGLPVTSILDDRTLASLRYEGV